MNSRKRFTTRNGQQHTQSQKTVGNSQLSVKNSLRMGQPEARPDVNSPKRDQVFMFDRAGNSQGGGMVDQQNDKTRKQAASSVEARHRDATTLAPVLNYSAGKPLPMQGMPSVKAGRGSATKLSNKSTNSSKARLL